MLKQIQSVIFEAFCFSIFGCLVILYLSVKHLTGFENLLGV